MTLLAGGRGVASPRVSSTSTVHVCLLSKPLEARPRHFGGGAVRMQVLPRTLRALAIEDGHEKTGLGGRSQCHFFSVNLNVGETVSSTMATRSGHQKSQSLDWLGAA